MRISDWSSDVCSSDLGHQLGEIARDHDRQGVLAGGRPRLGSSHCIDQSAIARSPCRILIVSQQLRPVRDYVFQRGERRELRSEEHTSELQSLMRISYAVFCLKKKTNRNNDV